MVGRLLRVTGTVLVIAVAFVTPVLFTSAPASADTVINGCTIVSNPTPTNFTNCPGADLPGANLSAVNLSFANLDGAQFADCVFAFPVPPFIQCTGANLDGANLTGADLANASFVACQTFLNPFFPSCGSSGLVGADLTDTNLANTTLAGCAIPSVIEVSTCSGADFSEANLSGAALTGATIEACIIPGLVCTSATLSGANLTGTIFVPSDQTVPATSSAGAVVTYSIPTPLTLAMPTTCSPPSGSTFPIGSTTVTCTVFDDQGDQATGTFTVTVQGAPEQLASLLVTVTNIGPGTSLADKVQAAQAAVAADLPAQAIGDLKALINEVQAQTGKKLTPTQATAIIAASTRIINVLST